MRERGEDEATLVRHEEELAVGTRTEQVGAVRARKHVETRTVAETVARDTEDADVERVAAVGEDSGEIETLPDGSVSIPLFEEELVVTKRLVVRERVIVRKRTLTDHEHVEAELRRERIEIDADPGIELEQD